MRRQVVEAFSSKLCAPSPPNIKLKIAGVRGCTNAVYIYAPWMLRHESGSSMGPMHKKSEKNKPPRIQRNRMCNDSTSVSPEHLPNRCGTYFSCCCSHTCHDQLSHWQLRPGTGTKTEETAAAPLCMQLLMTQFTMVHVEPAARARPSKKLMSCTAPPQPRTEA